MAKNPTQMALGVKIGIMAVLVVAVGAVMVAKSQRSGNAQNTQESAAVAAAATPGAAVPKLLDLGSTKCVPCKMMAPILEELRTENKGKLEVVFIDVMQAQGASEAYNISMIPTQIFYGADGKELFRHEGFFSKADMLAKWKELGVTLAADAATTATQP